MILFSDRGTPNGYRYMDGFGSHTFKWVNAKGEVFWVKYHFKTNQGIKNLNEKEVGDLMMNDPSYSTRDLYDSIKKGDFPTWTWFV